MNYTIKSMHYKEKCEKINKFTILLLTDETRLNYIESALANCGGTVVESRFIIQGEQRA